MLPSIVSVEEFLVDRVTRKTRSLVYDAPDFRQHSWRLKTSLEHRAKTTSARCSNGINIPSPLFLMKLFTVPFNQCRQSTETELCSIHTNATETLCYLKDLSDWRTTHQIRPQLLVVMASCPNLLSCPNFSFQNQKTIFSRARLMEMTITLKATFAVTKLSSTFNCHRQTEYF